jgi:hypothetical protein
VRYVPEKFTIWDVVDVNEGDLSPNGLCAYIQVRFACVYGPFI